MMVRATENEILVCLNRIATGQGVVLTHAHKLFFLRLLECADKYGQQSLYGLSVTLSVQELSVQLAIPLRTATQSLNRLVSCGALERQDGEKTFPRSATITTIPKNIYEKEN